ncbi:hypothetical protein OK116_08355 [Xylella fastidiosa subsp. fastidiosa]|nr:hypothetical protein [Xylella fastidiosa]MDC7964085.1 hypothetical protein [Xylella fastidiosa]UIT49521.1 hypothetical protein LZ752_08170 [Xylella fastidiosa subsp. fastidiosa]UIT51672.1 hypothetical protein LZ753_08100 [Xylella fastidiosa subsp. fastidiosa]WCF15466.1 hypothetical protein OK115_02570 [Xylella fastidiosa subsp. fastidiosa]WCF16733.1 hypothetical protein OK116_08355 [Xylella fastidiosa subsp. fastidiosa]
MSKKMRRERCSVRLRRTAVLHIYTGLLKTSAANSEGKRAPLSESVLDDQHCKAQRLLRWGTLPGNQGPGAGRMDGTRANSIGPYVSGARCNINIGNLKHVGL